MKTFKKNFSKLLSVSTIAFAVAISMLPSTTYASEGENVINLKEGTATITEPGNYTITTNAERVRNGGHVGLLSSIDNAVYNITISDIFISQTTNWSSVFGITNDASNVIVNLIIDGDNELIGHNHEGIKVSNTNDADSITLKFATKTGGKLTTSSNYTGNASTYFNGIGTLNLGMECETGIKNINVDTTNYSSIQEAWNAGTTRRPFVLEVEKISGGHLYGEWVVDVEPTQSSVGSKHRECSICGKIEAVEIPVLDVITPPDPIKPEPVKPETKKVDVPIKVTSSKNSNDTTNTVICLSVIVLSCCFINFTSKKKKTIK